MKSTFRSWRAIGLVLAVACVPPGEKQASQTWPPPRVPGPDPNFVPTTDFQTSGGHGAGWTRVYQDAAMQQPVSNAYLFTNVRVDVGYNVFAIPAPANRFVRSSYEVTYYDDSRTQIKADSLLGDRIAILNDGTMALTFPGAKVRYGSHVYELHADGWYLGGHRVHTFSTRSH